MSNETKRRYRFYGQLWQYRSGLAKGWMAAGLLIWLALWLAIAFRLPFDVPQLLLDRLPAGFSGWRVEDSWTAIALVVLVFSAPLMHTSDARLRGGGFKSRYRESLAWIPLDDGTVSGLLSVQSIRTAVTTFILTALVGLVPKKDGVAIWGSVGEFNVTLGVAVGLALILSLVTTLVATLCLDYSIRFSWTPAEARLKNRSPSLTGAALTAALKAASELADNTKFTLRDKARVLNEIGFYFLMWAIAALPAFFSVYACLASSFLVYVVTWCYYFFPGNDPGGVIKTATTSSDPLAQAITGLISKAAGQVVAEELNRAANEAEVSAKQAKDAADAAAHSSRVAHEAAQAAQALASELAKRIQGPAS